MFSRGASFVIVLIALALLGGAAAIGNGTRTPDALPPSGLEAAAISARERQTLADILQQLSLAQKTGGVSPVTYRSVDRSLKKLESKGADTRKARELMRKVVVGGVMGKKSAAPTGGRKLHRGEVGSGVTLGAFDAVRREIEDAGRQGRRFSREHYVRVEDDLALAEKSGTPKEELARLRALLRERTPHLADEEQAREEARRAASATAPCTNPPPILTADITDFSKIRRITAPGTASSEGPKGHSFIWTGGERVPIYAPVTGVYDSGSFSRDAPKAKAQYLLFFRISGSCGYQFKFDHIDEPIPAIRAELPNVPKIADSRGTVATARIEFQAGELIGYTSGNVPSGNWDFGLYDMTREGALKAYGCFGMHCHSVCWTDYYAGEKRERYRRLFEGAKLVCSF